MQKKLLTIIITLAILSVIGLTTSADVYNLAMNGGKLSSKEAAKLEQQLTLNPQDIDLRTKLLGYYFSKTYKEPSARQAKCKHVLWLIANKPEAEVLALPYGELNKILDQKTYNQGKKLWLNHLKSPTVSLNVLENSAAAFMVFDKKLAEASLKKAQSQDPENPKWALKLGHLYLLQTRINSSKAKPEAAVKSLEQFAIAYKLSSKQDRSVFLQYMIKAALAAQQIEQAQQYAKEMLENNPKGWNYGNNIHHANIILGEIALKKGDVKAAKQYLIKAGKTPGSPQLNSFGPSMKLANKLLQQNERDIVLEYFKLCSKFWKGRGGKQLTKWTEVVKSGKIPNFGPRLF